MARRFAIGILVMGLLAAAPAANASPILNGGFETSGFAGWTVEGAESGSLLFPGGYSHSGNEAAWFGAMSKFDDVISQTLTTIPEASYEVSFWLAHGATDNSNAFTVSWGNTVLLDLDNAQKFGPRLYTYSVAATSAETTLGFAGRELRDYFYLDDVSVTPFVEEPGVTSIATPEPGTSMLVGVGIVTLARDRRRR